MSGCKPSPAEKSRDYPISPVDFTRVKLQEGFWKKWVETVQKTTIPFAFQKCEETGRIDNFIFAGGLREGKFRGKYGFNDSDLYKIMEGAAYALMIEEDPELAAYLDSLVYYVSGAQEEDGYLYTAWTLKANEYNEFYCCTYSDQGRWLETSNSSHEFYNAGHMYEAAVAHYLATGSRAFLDVALKNADLVYEVCIILGNDFVPGHQEIEIGLARLYRATGEKRYLQLAKHLLDIRGDVLDGSYSQAHLPVTEQDEAVGHAVRANYMYSAMADVAALTGDSAYLEAIGKLWDNVVEKKLSITGGVGASRRGEAYGENYELPNDPYNETCAAIANVYWNHRMFLLHGDSRYIDVLERTLYNGVISGLSLDGRLFFYPNTLRHDGESTFNQGVNGRSPWFSCSCCPSNLSRFVPSVAGYAYAGRGDDIYVNLFMNSDVSLETPGGELSLSQRSSYPWEGHIQLEFTNEKEVRADLHIRIPGWAMNTAVPSDLFRFADRQESRAELRVNGKSVEIKTEKGYVVLQGRWRRGDQISLELPMEDRIIVAHEKVIEKTGLLAVQCGPLVYCAEEIDNEADVLEAGIPSDARFEPRFAPRLLGGVNMLEGEGLRLVPYYAWANREVGKMNVWFHHIN
ncbi:MAG: glycoside hydrolase family 127 protein [Bacteroidales bacterium]|nr:glycoside hydrolase family 127 protein [Bacteroidales bacterium]